MSKKQWYRIWDDQIARFGRRSMTFQSPVSLYTVCVDEAKQDFIAVQHGNDIEFWPIERIEHCGPDFRLSGMAWPMSQIGLTDHYWFELVLGPSSEIKYWGDEVLHRVDTLSRVTGVAG